MNSDKIKKIAPRATWFSTGMDKNDNFERVNDTAREYKAWDLFIVLTSATNRRRVQDRGKQISICIIVSI